ncbi:MAG: hypothetical protein JW850_12010 [Thermoflexales bacterium]|nr:hypothetical protein [Thermoflexales bacterium]
MEVVSERIVDFISRLEPEQDTNSALERLLENELTRRLNRYQLTDRSLSRKYGMPFSEFKDRRVVERHDYSFDVESDFWDWEMALDGIETVESMLAELKESDAR